MENIIYTQLEGKPIHVHLTRRARKQVNGLQSPLYVGMELYFSCFIKKRVNVRESVPAFPLVRVAENMYVFFRPVQSQSCNIHELEGENTPNLIDLPIQKRQAIIPKNLTLDFKGGVWKGHFSMINEN
ncbi:MAG: hypothetical protein OEY56_02880 [Cyclobacteriaceae bacterium]|nr:hypothetical protein [Cyclobacteriaceae bacterium]